MISTDESNENTPSTVEQKEQEEEIVVIRPLDPAMAHIRYLSPKLDDAPQYTLVLDLDETLIHYRDKSVDTLEDEDE